MTKIITISLCLMLSQVAFADPGTPGRRVAIQVYAYGPTEVTPTTFARSRRTFARDMAKLADVDAAYSIHAYDFDELERELTKLDLKPGDLVARLKFDGHGSNGFFREVDDSVVAASRMTIIKASVGNLDFVMPLTAPGSADLTRSERIALIESYNARAIAGFAPIRGRFTPDALVYFDSCRHYSKDDPRALAAAVAVRTVLGLRSGSIYGNYTSSQMALLQVVTTPFWMMTGWRARASAFAAQGLAAAAVGKIGYWLATQEYSAAATSIALSALGIFTIRHLRDRGFVVTFGKDGANTNRSDARAFRRQFNRTSPCAVDLETGA